MRSCDQLRSRKFLHEMVLRSGVMAGSDADKWVSWVRAAELLGRHESTVQLYVAQGRICTRLRQGARPSVHLSSVHALAAQLRAERRARAVRAAARAARRAAKRRGPPDDGYVWLAHRRHRRFGSRGKSGLG